MPMNDAPMLGADSLLRDFMLQTGVAERLARPGVTEVAINRPGEIWTDSPAGWLKEGMPLLSELRCRQLANSMAAYVHRPLTPETPIQTLELPDGERALVVVPPACEKGTYSFTIRKPSVDRFALGEYVQGGRFSQTRAVSTSTVELEEWQLAMKSAHRDESWDAFFRMAIEHRQNIIIFGGPGSGKTTFAKALIDLYPTERRLITIEEINELQLPLHPNHVHLLYGGRVRPKELVAATLRMKPDHLFLAELTGDEAWHFMEILNTGNPGTVTTAHANDSLSGFARVAGLIKQSVVGQGLEMDYIQREVRMSFDVVVYMERKQILEVHFDPQAKLALLNSKSGRTA